MRILGFTTTPPSQGQTKTFQEFGEFLGRKPHLIGMVANLYPELSATFITEGLMNVLVKQPKLNDFEGAEDTTLRWEVKANEIKRCVMGATADGTGKYKSEIKFNFREVYFQKYDIFKIEDTNQQFIVVAPPVIHSNSNVDVYAKILDNDPNSELIPGSTYAGAKTRWIGNAQPEISEQGFTKHQSNFEVHTEHMTCVRNDITFTMQYAAREQVFIKTAEEGKNGVKYKMLAKEKELMENFMYSKNAGLLFNRSNHDANGRCMVQDREGRDVPVGNGIFTQIEMYADRTEYAKLTLLTFQDILSSLRSKSVTPQGNDYILVCNDIFYDDAQRVLGQYLTANKSTESLLYSKKAGQRVDVGVTFDSYSIGGNKLTIKQDRALTLEYPNRGFALIIDLSADKTTGRPAVQGFTLKGQEFIRSTYNGIGGVDGKTSGNVSSLTTASTISYMGYAGVAVYAPYRSHIISQAR